MVSIKKKGRTYILEDKPVFLAGAGVVAKTEREGPLGTEFDYVADAAMSESSWESAESAYQQKAVEIALKKAGVAESSVDIAFCGDLLNQCMGSSFGMRGTDIPLCGLFGACSTMALAMGLCGIMTEVGVAKYSLAVTSSHFCGAEKQFRQPLEYGGQRPPTAQRTVTGAGAALIASKGQGPHLAAVHFGKVIDYGVTDENNMGAAMAPAAAHTIAEFLKETGTTPDDYDMILTGDLGYAGSELLIELLMTEYGFDIEKMHEDCGLLIFDRENQDVHCGGSGCGCSATVVSTYIRRLLCEEKLKKLLFVGTGALVSTVSPLQGNTVPGIAHAVLLEA